MEARLDEGGTDTGFKYYFHPHSISQLSSFIGNIAANARDETGQFAAVTEGDAKAAAIKALSAYLGCPVVEMRTGAAAKRSPFGEPLIGGKR